MALWGNNDSKTSSGTVQIYANGLVTGSSTLFQTQARVGDFIQVANNDYMIISITSNTAAQVVGPVQNTSVTAQNAGSSYNLNEKPKSALMDDGYHNQGYVSGTTNTIYGMDTTEASVTNGAIREVVFITRGSGYQANATLTVAGGVGNTVAAAGNAQSNSIGRITAINFSNNGVGYTIAPTLTVSAPGPIYFNGNVTLGSVVLGNATSDSTTQKLDNGWIALGTTNTAFLANGDIVTYAVQASNVAIGGLTSGQSYSVYTINSSAIQLYLNVGGTQNTFINLSSVSATAQANHSLTGTTAVVAPILSGVHESDHAGWVRRIVGTGGRAGRVTHETLVAMGTIAGDASDDTVMPDA
jgi:hypothetical protein